MQPRDVERYIKAKLLLSAPEGESARTLIARLEKENPGIEQAAVLMQRIIDNDFSNPAPALGTPQVDGLWGSLFGAVAPHLPGALNKVAEAAGQSVGALLTGVAPLAEGKAFSVQGLDASGITVIVVQVRGGLTQRRAEELLDQVDGMIPVKRR